MNQSHHIKTYWVIFGALRAPRFLFRTAVAESAKMERPLQTAENRENRNIIK